MITFKVDDVEREPHTFQYQSVAQALAERGIEQIEACSAGEVVKCVPCQGFIMAAYLAYVHHLPLRLSPDHVWLCIAQGAARHILLNAEASRERWVSHQGQLALAVRRDHFVRGNPDNDWPDAIAEFSEQLQEHIGKRHALLVSDFSTTGSIERTASEIVLMSAMQKYFRYVVMTLCGIPEITLEGSPEDWRSVVERARALEVLGAEAWLKQLIPVLEKIEASSRGDVDRSFWQHFFKRVNMSGGSHISGWINVFFPYLGDDVEVEDRNWTVLEDYSKTDPFSAPDMSRFPQGMTQAPFRWMYFAESFPMQFSAGFAGATYDPTTEAVRPLIAWAVAPERNPRVFVHQVSSFAQSGAKTPPVSVEPLDASALTSLASLNEETADVERFELSLSRCSALRSFESLGHVRGLKSLDVWDCDALSSLKGLAEATELESIYIHGCAELADIHDLSMLPNLTHLTVFKCPRITFELKDCKNREEVVEVQKMIADMQM